MATSSSIDKIVGLNASPAEDEYDDMALHARVWVSERMDVSVDGRNIQWRAWLDSRNAGRGPNGGGCASNGAFSRSLRGSGSVPSFQACSTPVSLLGIARAGDGRLWRLTRILREKRMSYGHWRTSIQVACTFIIKLQVHENNRTYLYKQGRL